MSGDYENGRDFDDDGGTLTMTRPFENRLTNVNGSVSVRVVYTDDDGDEFVLISGERHYLSLNAADGDGPDADGDCPECGHPADNSSGHGTCDHPCHRAN
jgi:hypothetical protein